MRDTPLEIFLVIFTFTYAYAVFHGLEVLARISQIIVFVVTALLIVSTFMLLPEMKFSNLFPFLDLPFKDFLHGTQIITEIPFGELVIFLTLTFGINDTQHITRYSLMGLFSGALLLLMVTARNTAVLGNTELLLISPSFQAERRINIGFLSRMDILFAIGNTFGLFLKCSILFYGLILLLSQLIQLRIYSPVIFPTNCILIVLSSVIYSSVAEHFQFSQNVGIMFTIPFIPMLKSINC